MQNSQIIVSIGLELAKDAWQLIHDAKHPDYANKVVEGVKVALAQVIQHALSQQSAPAQKNACVAPVVEEVKTEASVDAA